MNPSNLIYFHNFSARNLPDYKKTDFNSMYVKDGIILEVGKNLIPPKDKHQRVDLKNQVIFAPFTDAHVHFTQTGITKLGCDLSRVKTIGQLLKKIENLATSKEKYILGWHMQEGKLKERRPPSLKELDKACSNSLVWITRADLHSAVMNSKGQNWANNELRKANLDEFILEKNNNFISGEGFYFLAGKLAESLPEDYKFKAFKLVEDMCLKQGVGTVHAFEGDEYNEADSLALDKYLKKSYVHGVIYHQSTSPKLPLKQYWKQMGGCLLVDGALGSRTAALYDDYADDKGNKGLLYKTTEEVIEVVKAASNYNLQLAMHTIGDRANDLLATCYLAVKEKMPNCPCRHRIEHFILPTFKAIRNAKKAGALICVQPAFDYFWGGKNRLYEARLGRERALKANPYKTLIDSGLKLAGGSDSPVTPINPILGIHALVNHSNLDERLDLNTALALFIANAHEFSGESGHRGFLRKGFHCDFICLSKDPFKYKEKKLKNIKVNEFYLRGNLIYSRGSKFKQVRDFLLKAIKKLIKRK